MKPVTQELLRQAAAAFAFDRPAGEAERFGAGHINDTFAVWAADRSKRWILQRINTDTFTDPAGLMENVTGVTAYLRRQIIERGGDPDRETLNVIPTLDGKPYYTDTEGGAWRAYIFVEGTVCLQKVENERDFYTAAETFGNFQNQLAGYPAATLHETIATTPPTATPTLKRPWPPTSWAAPRTLGPRSPSSARGRPTAASWWTSWPPACCPCV